MKNGSSRTIGSSARMSAARATTAQYFDVEWAKTGSRMSDLGDLLAAHQAGRADGKDEQDDEEGDALLEIGVDDAEKLLEQADHEAADENADRILKAAENRCGERLDAGYRAHIGPGEGDRGDEDAAEPGERRGEDEGKHHHAGHVDSHDRRRIAVEGDGDQRLAEHRTAQEDLHRKDSAERGGDDEKLLRKDPGRTNLHDGLAERRGELDLLGPPDIHCRVLEDDADRHRAQHPAER